MVTGSSTKQTIKEYSRGIIGGLIFSLPIIYTMEVWWTGFIASPLKILVFVLATYALLLGYNRFAGMRKDASFWEVCWDSVEEICLAFIVSFLFLVLINRVGLEMSFMEIAGKVIVESMIVAIGISVGTAQLGQGNREDEGMDGDDNKEKEQIGHTFVLAICGATLFAAPVAPTEEIVMIGIENQTIHILMMLAVSLFLSFVILFFSDFKGSSRHSLKFPQMLLHVLVGYFSAMLVSFCLLWFFGRIEQNSIQIILAQIIVLSVPGSIGASAGRLLIKGGS